jgi:5-methylcytosine-specific restriction endonuclease McrA
MVDALGWCCQACGYSGYLNALQFHHIDPQKKELRLAYAYHRKWELVRSELDKCVLLCANCHAEEHDRDFASGLDLGISTLG